MGTQIKHVTIVGGGLAGCLLANLLARRGYQISIYEYRADPRAEQGSAHRSINLALSARGLHALSKVGLDKTVLQAGQAMRGRCIHMIDKELMYQTYGVKAEQVIYAVERENLHRILVEAIADNVNVNCQFNHRVTDWDPQTGELSLITPDQQEKTLQTELVIGADGAHSLIRQKMVEKAGLPFTEEDMTHGYKELIIPAETAADKLDPNWLHIWPRESFMMIALPNTDHTFTGTLFMANEGEVSFANIQSEQDVMDFFKRYFPSILQMIPTLVPQFLQHPVGHIPSVTGYPWHVLNRGCLIGDAAHAIMPFYGQGMNSAFEDCEILADLIDTNRKNWDKAFLDFERNRKANADAIAEMSMENYIEMRDKVTDPEYLKRREIEHYLMEHFPDKFINQYSMVSFECVPYAFAQHCGALQNKLIDSLMADISDVSELDNLPHLDDRIHNYAKVVMDLKMKFM